ncbi:MAG TPA: aldehyde dehydrogenase family protein [Candidatus Binatia bacterium]|nr:aldehyde dehydrogenase family protein [Candidatus Binatia bacterium]
MEEYRLYVDGAFCDAGSGRTVESINPATEEPWARVARAGREDTQRAIRAARRAFDEGPWPRMSQADRARILNQIADGLQARAQEIAVIETKDSGGTIRKTGGDLMLANAQLRYFAEMAERLPLLTEIEVPQFPAQSKNWVQREPFGVCGQIIPWNFPLMMAVWKLGPALATGNTVVLKPATDTPCSALELAKIIDQTDLPKGVVNVIHGSGAECGEELCTSPLVDKVAFTGSTAVGRRIMQLASDTVKKVTLELGGKSANILLDDADLDMAIDGSLFGCFFHQGQACESGTRLLVSEAMHDRVVERLVERTKLITCGDPLDMASAQGPLISARQRETVEGYIRKGVEEGAKIAVGGRRPAGLPKGYYVEPTILVDVKNAMTVAQEEIFGPVLVVIRYRTIDDAIRIANDSIYGLGGAVWSRDLDKAMAVAKAVRTGTMWINEYHMLSVAAPFGGYKQSGIGREFGLEGILEYMQIKHIHVDQVGNRAGKFWYGALFGA